METLDCFVVDLVADHREEPHLMTGSIDLSCDGETTVDGSFGGLGEVDDRNHWWASRNPGRGHGNDTSRPVLEQVMYAVRRSSPPKQMLVVSRSPVA